MRDIFKMAASVLSLACVKSLPGFVEGWDWIHCYRLDVH